jgi:hypothetical protein
VLTDAHAPQQGNIEWAINSAVKVSAGRGDATLPLKHPQVVRCYAELSSGLRYVHTVHLTNSKP